MNGKHHLHHRALPGAEPLWSDYGGPSSRYDFEIRDAGPPAHLRYGSGDVIKLSIDTERKKYIRHSIWFNRGTMAGPSRA